MIAIVSATIGFSAFDVLEVHPLRAQQIAEITKMETTWTAKAHPRFSAEAPGASSPLNGVKGNWGAGIRDAIQMGTVKNFVPHADFAEIAVPAEFDSETNWPKCAKIIGDIRDQSACGCCWAFGGAEAASDRMCIATDAKIMMPLSAQDICFNSNYDGCNGGQIDTPWHYIKDTGVVTGGQNKGTGPFGGGFCSDYSLAHCHHHGPIGKDPYPSENTPGCPLAKSPAGPTQCDSGASSPHSNFKTDKVSFQGDIQSASGADAIQKMIMEGGPVETAFTVYSDFENYASGIYKHVSGGFAGGHAVKIVGWGAENGEKYWKVANSWNPFWGEKGYFRIAFGQCGIDDQVIGTSSSATWGQKSQL